jgi:hypothetical protein
MTRTRLLLICVAAACATATGATSAGATTVDVRIEGRSQTLFEGPVRNAGGPVRASSDTRQRTCNGTNNLQHPLPGASATSAAVDGIRLAGMDFDATWFPGFDDYYVERFGPDREALGAEEYWGILVNDAFTPVGGCQAQVVERDRVLWAFDAFHERGFLKLAAAGDANPAPAPIASAVVGEPFPVVVTRTYGDTNPTFARWAGAKVAPVTTAENGTQRTEPQAAGTVTTASDGTADVVFGAPGWHRIKAEDGAGAIRSNRLDVCVGATAGATCGPPPADTEVRQAPPLPPDPDPPATHVDPVPPPAKTTPDPTPPPVGAPVLELPRFTASGAKQGRVSLRWRVLQPGAGIARWQFASRLAGQRSGTYVVRAKGTKGTSAQLALPAGRTWSVQATFVDALGRAVSEVVGDVLVPVDERARTVRRTGRWRAAKDAKAWKGGILRGSVGARLQTKLAAGRLVLLVRGVRRRTDLEVTAGTRRTTYRITGSTTAQTRELALPKRTAAGTVGVRVVAGELGIDGLGVRP